MSDAVLPKIKVTDPRNLDGSAAGTSGLDSPSTTDGGQSGRPKSGSSSEGTLLQIFEHVCSEQVKVGLCRPADSAVVTIADSYKVILTKDYKAIRNPTGRNHPSS
jgi:hypothetical protein